MSGKILDVLVCLEKLNVRIDFVVLKNLPFVLVIVRSALKQLGGVLDIKSKKVQLNYREQDATLPMASGYSQS